MYELSDRFIVASGLFALALFMLHFSIMDYFRRKKLEERLTVISRIQSNSIDAIKMLDGRLNEVVEELSVCKELITELLDELPLPEYEMTEWEEDPDWGEYNSDDDK